MKEVFVWLPKIPPALSFSPLSDCGHAILDCRILTGFGSLVMGTEGFICIRGMLGRSNLNKQKASIYEVLQTITCSLASERGEKLGDSVGYKVRLEI
ncbi:hypothetical protein RchiOBHm_Chr2g0141241 [Rosa chinensis]|uniref:Uncharacterized protein n=1 Tax=Rosa chinensis TaxID=74649 RepID=A0A2P6RXL9_ROSCH|nr:hypothetical protein RchiOBHm_Chr2g0141241 [Rosa chinensis]